MPLHRSVPSRQGVRPEGILRFVRAIEAKSLGLHALSLVRNGNVIAEGVWKPYAIDRPHELYSLTKSFMSTAVGLAVAEGLLDIDERVIDCFPDRAPAAPSSNLRAMRIRHLLSMSTGHAQEPTGIVAGERGNDWASAFFGGEVVHPPGTHFLYNSAASHMAGMIVESRSKQKLVDYLRPRLFDPLGIGKTPWQTDSQGHNTGGWGLSLGIGDIAAFGQLYLDKGVWEGKRLIRSEWVDLATTKHIDNGTDPSNDWNQGYGFQFWRCRHGIYRGDGAFGQYCMVMPTRRAVLAITSGTTDMQGIMNLAWEHLLPAMEDGPIEADASAERELADVLAGLSLPTVAAVATGPSGGGAGPASVYQLDKNDLDLKTLQLTAQPDGWTLTLEDAIGTHAIRCGNGRWVGGSTRLRWQTDIPVAASGGWIEPTVWRVKLYFTDTPYAWEITARFDGDRVQCDVAQNVSFGPTRWGPIAGVRGG